MTKEEFKGRLISVVKEYIRDEEGYDDNAQLCIKPATMDAYLADSREVDVESPDIECYDVMELVEMNPEGKWKVDEASVEAVAEEYFK
ncbi:MAG: hypothetical protein K2N05_01170 [Muribaculaceae bacterium]|nr:hypothetical protein [Muribaculaceae bacterium]